MESMEKYKKTVELLRLHEQEHLLAFYDQLTGLQKQQLLDGINALDFSAVDHWIENYVRANGGDGIPDHFEPAPSHPPEADSGILQISSPITVAGQPPLTEFQLGRDSL